MILRSSIVMILLASALAAFAMRVRVVLQSGASQEAEYLGISKDTLYVGGTIDGVAHKVGLPRARLARVLSIPGQAPLNLDSLFAASSPTSETPSADSLPASPPPSTNTSWNGRIALFPPEGPAAGSLAKRLMETVANLLSDPLAASPRWVDYAVDFPGCGELDCILSALKEGQAAGLLALHADSSKGSFEARFRFIEPSSGKSQEYVWSGAPNLAQFTAEGAGIAYARFSGKAMPRSGPRTAWVRVESEPDGADLRVDSGAVVCRTPCTLRLRNERRTLLEASWSQDQQLWAGQARIIPILGDTLSSFIRLRRADPIVVVRSLPSGAEIQLSDSLALSQVLVGRTPQPLRMRHLGDHQARLFLRGFRDTLVHFRPDATERLRLDITLTPLEDPALLAQQDAFLKLRARQKAGKYITAASAGVWVTSGLLWWLAEKDYARASELRKSLEQPSSQSGPIYQQKAAANREAWEDGETKTLGAAALAVLGAGMLGLGLVLWF